MQIPLRQEGVWKTLPNNLRRTDGTVHECCPPAQVQSEMDRFIELQREIEVQG